MCPPQEEKNAVPGYEPPHYNGVITNSHPGKFDAGEVSRARVFAQTAQSHFGEAVKVNMKDNQVTIDATGSPISEKNWEDFTYLSTLGHSSPLLNKVKLAVRDGNGVLSSLPSGNAAASDILSYLHRKSVMKGEDDDVKTGRSHRKQSVPALSNVDSVMDNFSRPTRGSMKYVTSATFGVGCACFYTCAECGET
jgi:hypothetical protein